MHVHRAFGVVVGELRAGAARQTVALVVGQGQRQVLDPVVARLDSRLDGVLLPVPGREVALHHVGGGVALRVRRIVAVGGVIGIVLGAERGVAIPVLRALNPVVPGFLLPHRRQRAELHGRGARAPHRLVGDLVGPHGGQAAETVIRRRHVVRHVDGLIGAVDLGIRPRPVMRPVLVGLAIGPDGVEGHLHESLPAPLMLVPGADAVVVDRLDGHLVARIDPVGDLEVGVDLVRLAVAELDEVEQRAARMRQAAAQVGIAERAFVGGEVGEVLDGRRPAETEREPVEVVEGLGRIPVTVGVPAHLAAELVGALARADGDDPRERVAVLGVHPARQNLGAGHGQVRDVRAAAEEWVRDLEPVELELHLAGAPAAEVETVARSDDAGLGRHGHAEVVHRKLLELFGADLLLAGRGLGVDLVLGADLDLLDRLHDLLRSERELDGRGLPGVDRHFLHLLVVANRLHLELHGADRNAGDREGAVFVGSRSLLGAEHDHVGERRRILARLEDLACDPSGGRPAGRRRTGHGLGEAPGGQREARRRR